MVQTILFQINAILWIKSSY